MRVLLVDLAKTFGGAEVRTLLQAAALQGRTDHCAVAVLAGSELQRRLDKRGIPYHAIVESRSSPKILFAMQQIIRDNRYSVIDAHNVQSIFWGHLAAWRVGAQGRVATIHSDYAREYPGLKGKLYAASLTMNQQIAKAYITVTEQLQVLYAPRIDSTLIYNAVEVPTEPQQGKPNPQFFAPDDFVVAIIGRLVPVKGHQYLIDALAQLTDYPHIKLLIVGDGILRDELSNRVIELGLQERVVFTGFRNDIPQILQSVDAVCMASLSEAMPFVVLEAATAARPLVVTQVGGLNHLLTNEQTALMVPPQSADALAAALRRLAGDSTLAQRLGQAGYDMVKTSFSTDAMIEQVLTVYQRALTP